jgi:serine/threonine protein kinase
MSPKGKGIVRDLIGRTLGHYRIVEKIGEGGMGVVYRAHDERLDRDVAVKVLPAEVADSADRLSRFEREAKAVAKLDHPNILAIHDFGSEGGVTYAVMELLEGESLRELIARGGLTTGMAVGYARAIADGLAAAHDKGILHRDLKPENVFLTQDGRIKILDFGLAKLTEPEVALTTETPTETLDTKPGGVMGTIAYMAPEQLQGKPADDRSDIFALGVVLYEMLTGRRPFPGGTTAEVAAGVLERDPDPVDDTIPGSLATVISKCLAKRPEDRFSSAHDLSLTLGAIDSGTIPSPPRDKSFIERRWPHLAAVVIAAIIALLFVLPPESLFDRSGEAPPETPPEEAVPRLVVLPFENLGDPEDEYFADGITEELISRLAGVSGLQVISRKSAMYYKDKTLPLQQIGKELDVRYVLEGTIRWDRRGESYGRVRITPQLIEVKDNSHLWADQYDRDLEDIFAVQSEIARRVVDEIRVSLLDPEEEALDLKATGNFEAYKLYLRAANLRSLNDQDMLLNRIGLYEQAVELDPEFAEAWALLGNLHSVYHFFGYDPTPERLQIAKAAIDRALEIDPDLFTVRITLAIFHYRNRDYELALEELDRLSKLQPDNSGVLKSRAYILRRQGDFEQSTLLMERAIRISPRDYEIPYALSVNNQFLRRFSRAEEYADLTIMLGPVPWDGHVRKMSIMRSMGRFGEWRELLGQVLNSPRVELDWIDLEFRARDFEATLDRIATAGEMIYEEALGEMGSVGLRALTECECHYYMGNRERLEEACNQARAVLEKGINEIPDNRVFRERLAKVYALLGRKDEAVTAAKKAVELLPISKDALEGTEPLQTLAEVYALVGMHDESIDQIDHLLSVPSDVTVAQLEYHPVWDPLRDHPRFQALLEKYDTN